MLLLRNPRQMGLTGSCHTEKLLFMPAEWALRTLSP
jgi:hypothetical protein